MLWIAMCMFFSNLKLFFGKRTFINVLFWNFHFKFEKTMHIIDIASVLPLLRILFFNIKFQKLHGSQSYSSGAMPMGRGQTILLHFAAATDTPHHPILMKICLQFF